MEQNMKSFDGLYLGFLMGGVIGILAGFMFAPKSGKELRADMKKKGYELYRDTQRIISEAETKTRSIIDDAMHRADDFKREAEQRLSEARLRSCKIFNCASAETAPLHAEEESGAEA
jgi:gas vesicle protein